MFEQLLEILSQCDENPGMGFPLPDELYTYARFDNQEIRQHLMAVVWDRNDQPIVTDIILNIHGEDDHEERDDYDTDKIEDNQRLYAVYSTLTTNDERRYSVMRVLNFAPIQLSPQMMREYIL